MQGHWVLGNGRGWRVRLEGPMGKLTLVIIDVAMERLKTNLRWTPAEPVGAVVSIQFEFKRIRSLLLADVSGPYGVIAIWCLGMAPAAKFDVYFMGCIRSHLGFRVVKKSENDVLVQLVHPSAEPELISAEAQALLCV